MKFSRFWILLPQFGSQLRSLHLSMIGVSESNGLTGRPRRRKTLLFPKKIDQKEIAGILGNRSDLFSRQRKRDDLRHLSSTLADWSEGIRSTFGNQSVIAWILIGAVMIVAVAQL